MNLRILTMVVAVIIGLALLITSSALDLIRLDPVAYSVLGIGIGMLLMDVWIDYEHRRDDEDDDDNGDDDNFGDFDVSDGEEIQMGPFKMQFAMMVPTGMMGPDGQPPSGFRVGHVHLDESKLPTEEPSDEVPDV